MSTLQRRPLDIGTLTTRELIQNSISDFTREDLYIAIPAVVLDVSDYETMQCVSVQGLINDIYEDEGKLSAVRINKVFVKLPAGGDVAIKLPIAVGNKVTLHWAHRNLIDYLAGDGGEVDVAINMVAGVRDCWVTHGFGTRSNHQNPSATDLIIEHKNTVITVKPDGRVSVLTQGNIDIETPANVTVKCNSATVDSPITTMTGNVQIDGNTQINGNLVTNGSVTSKTSMMSPSYSGYAGAGSMSIGSITASGTVTIQGVAVNTHTHLYDGTSVTSPMQ